MTPPYQRCVIRLGAIFVFLCMAIMLPVGAARAAPPALVVTLPVTFPAKDSADAWGLAMPNNPKTQITDRGFCWSITPDPSYPKDCSGLGAGAGFYSLPLSGLKPGHTYYVRAYAMTTLGPAVGAQISFTLPPPYNPAAITSDPVTTGPDTAILGGAATDQGHAEVLERGVVWSTKPLPDFHDNVVPMGSGLGAFSREVDGFTPGVSYYVRAYASSDIGTGWGQDKVFATSDTAPPTVTTTAPYNETDVAALSGGNVTNEGGDPVTARGVCWSTQPNPSVSDASTMDGQGLGQFHSAITGLDPLTDYWVRAYATNSGGTSYGQQYQFKTVHPVYPSVHTVGTVEVYDDSALLQGEVVLTGDATADERGFCWSTTPQPMVSDDFSLAQGSGAGQFDVMLDGLQPEALYYARAFARNQYGVFYGHIIYFQTKFSKYPCR